MIWFVIFYYGVKVIYVLFFPALVVCACYWLVSAIRSDKECEKRENAT